MNFTKWFYSIDNKLFTAICLLMILGFMMIMAASPAVSERIAVGHFHFIEKQIIYLVIGLVTMLILSAINERSLRIIIFFGFVFTLIMLISVLLIGDTTKGSKRWLNIFGFSLQPSEFLKPFYSGIVALILANKEDDLKTFLGLISFHGWIIFLLLSQPDFGMSILISTVFLIQLFIADINILWLFTLGGVFLFIGFLAYQILPHVAKRIEKFLDSDSGEVNYQVQKSLDSYYEGGLFGKGAGEGTIKFQLPDAHTDFIFPVAAEELGMFFCIFTVCLIMYVVTRGFIEILKLKKSKYKFFIGIPIISYFAIQSLFNIAVTLNLIPTKGMTLPFISYGGSSLITQSIMFGIFLNITKNSSIKNKSPIHARL